MNENDMIQQEFKGVTLTDLIGETERLAERAEKLEASLDLLERDLVGLTGTEGPQLGSPVSSSGGHFGAMAVQLARIDNALTALESCRGRLAASIGDRPKLQPNGQSAEVSEDVQRAFQRRQADTHLAGRGLI